MDAEMDEALTTIYQNPAVKSVVLASAKPGCFIAGADIKLVYWLIKLYMTSW